jgi:hypothetical protein
MSEKIYTQEDMDNARNKSYDIGLKNGQGSHNVPSQETKDRLQKLEEAQKESFSDHDLLVKLNTQMSMVLDEIKLLKDVTTNRITCLEKDKADRVELQVIQKKVNEDIENRMRDLEKSVVDKNVYDERHNELVKQVDNLKISDAVINAKASQNSVVWAYIIGGVGILFGVIDLFIKLTK